KNKCPIPDYDEIVNLVISERRFSESSQSSGTSTIMDMLGNNLGLNSPMNVSLLLGNKIQKKHVDESTDKLSSKKAKKQVSKEDSSIFKKLIEELTSTVPENSEKVIELNENTNNFLYHYNKISQTESKNEIANKDRMCMFNLDEIRKQLPDNITNDALKKRKERSGKIYDLFVSI
ncbi:5874_t:CDS:2, partial [Cetraspora pellucida]